MNQLIIMTEYIKIFEVYLKKELKYIKPENLSNPVKYLLESGGKRLRPIIALNVSELLGGKISDTLPAAAALEIFHNFTLAHDDIMDNSMLRRGKKTINSKWDNNTGILSGDVMLIISYEVLKQYQDSKYIHLSKKLTEIARLVCEGQQADMDFASKNDITENEYFEMIKNRPSPSSQNLPRHDKIVSVNKSGPSTAMAVVNCAIPPKYFTDYLTILKTSDGWRIISKTFHTDIHE